MKPLTLKMRAIIPVLCLSVLVLLLLTSVVIHDRQTWPDDPRNLLFHYRIHRVSEVNVSSASVATRNTIFDAGKKLELESKTHILLWTKFFGDTDYLPSLKDKNYYDCPYQKCDITSDKNMLNKSGVVLFHWSDMNELPKYRDPDQYWVLFVLESPMNTPDFSHLNNIMNMTATYRMDSDIFTPYLNIRPKTPQETADYRPKDYSANKTKLVAWFVSNCHTSSNREGYVEELNKYIDVHVYGACGNYTCYPKMSFNCYNKVARDYYFYLSFENSLCKDYVTEKYFHILKSEPGCLPVVMSGADFGRLGPPGASINALDYPSPKDLATYLKKVAADSALYNAYFEWRERYTTGGRHWTCDICHLLNQPIRKKKIVSNFRKWWLDDAKCKKWSNGLFSYL